MNTQNTQTNFLIKFLRLPAVLSYLGFGRSSLYSRISDGLFPHPINLGGRAVAWPEYEVAAINDARVAGKSNEEIYRLVQELEAARKEPKLQRV